MHLRARITSGTWPVGTRLPTEPELLTGLGVARNTVEEAVRALANTGLVEIRQGSGTYVVATSELACVMQRRFAGTDHAQLNELRAVLESAAAAMAAQRRTAADLRTLDTALARREEAWRSRKLAVFADTDATFHLAVVAAAHNDVLTAIYADLREVIRGAIAAELDAAVGARPHIDHARLVEAIRAGQWPAGRRRGPSARLELGAWSFDRRTGPTRRTGVTAHPRPRRLPRPRPAARAALLGPHAHLAERRGRVLRYPVDVCPFLAFPDEPDDADWRDLAAAHRARRGHRVGGEPRYPTAGR